MAFRINKRVPLSNDTLKAQINNAWSELKRARALQQESATAWRTEEAHKQGGRAAWFEDQMNAALDVLAARILPPAVATPPVFQQHPPTQQ